MEDEKLLNELFTEIDNILDYFTEVKIDGIAACKSKSSFSPEELEALHKLIITKTGRQALAKVLKDYGESNMFSTLSYIDGDRGVKTLELVNADTGEPIADGMLHEYYCLFRQDQ